MTDRTGWTATTHDRAVAVDGTHLAQVRAQPEPTSLTVADLDAFGWLRIELGDEPVQSFG